MKPTTNRESGFGLVELFVGSTLLSIAVLGAIGGLTTSLKLAVDTKESNLSNDHAVSLVEEFRDACRADFDSAVATYNDRTIQVGKRAIHSRIILDETGFVPPIDLNGDGDTADTNLTSREIRVAYLQTTIRCGRKSMTHMAVIARNGSFSGGGSGSGGSGGGGGSSMTLAASSVSGDKINMSIDLVGNDVPVVAVTVQGSPGNFISEIKLGKDKVFADTANAPPIGAKVPTSTFTMHKGTSQISMKAQTSANGGGKSNLTGQSYIITLHHESGGTSVFSVN